MKHATSVLHWSPTRISIFHHSQARHGPACFPLKADGSASGFLCWKACYEMRCTVRDTGHHPSPAHSAIGAEKNGNGKQSNSPGFAPADSASRGLRESSQRFGHAGTQAPLRCTASWEPDQQPACLHCIPDQMAGGDMEHLCVERRF